MHVALSVGPPVQMGVDPVIPDRRQVMIDL
jgi:hypothetical protein